MLCIELGMSVGSLLSADMKTIMCGIVFCSVGRCAPMLEHDPCCERVFPSV